MTTGGGDGRCAAGKACVRRGGRTSQAFLSPRAELSAASKSRGSSRPCPRREGEASDARPCVSSTLAFVSLK